MAVKKSNITLQLRNGVRVRTGVKSPRSVINQITAGKIDIGRGSMAGIIMIQNGKPIGKLSADGWTRPNPTKKRQAKKKVAKKRATKKKVAKKKAARRNPIVKDHLIIAELREPAEAAARKKGVTLDKRLYFDGAGWTKTASNGARFHNRLHARNIAQLIADSNAHNNTLRQLAVIEDTHHPK